MDDSRRTTARPPFGARPGIPQASFSRTRQLRSTLSADCGVTSGRVAGDQEIASGCVAPKSSMLAARDRHVGAGSTRLGRVEFFEVGDEATVFRALHAAAAELDEGDAGWGNSGGDDFLPLAMVMPDDGDEPHVAEEPRALAVISGRGWVLGDGRRIEIAAGQGAWWTTGERWDIGAIDGPISFVEIEGPAVEPRHLRRRS